MEGFAPVHSCWFSTLWQPGVGRVGGVGGFGGVGGVGEVGGVRSAGGVEPWWRALPPPPLGATVAGSMANSSSLE